VAFNGFGTDDDRPVDGSGLGFHPVVDGVVIPQPLIDTIAAKGNRNVPLLIGTNHDEGTLFTLLLDTDATDEQMVAGLRRCTSDPAGVIAGLRAKGTGHALLADLFTDGVFRIPTLRVADAVIAAGVPAWVYLFTWNTPVFGGQLGATHALELPFVFNTLADPQWTMLVGDAPPVELADAMHEAWLAFARSGKPDHDGIPHWPTYDTERRPTLEFGVPCRVVDDPDGDTRKLWSA
jgi:para-nitrobenzyl esterase